MRPNKLNNIIEKLIETEEDIMYKDINSRYVIGYKSNTPFFDLLHRFETRRTWHNYVLVTGSRLTKTK